MSDISKIWKNFIVHPSQKPTGGSKRREYDRAGRRYKSYLLVTELMQKYEPELAEGKKNISVSESRINKLLDKIHESCPSRDIKLCHNFFIKGLAQGKKENNWDVVTPSTMIQVHRPKSPFTPDSFIALKALSALKKEFILSIEDPFFYQEESAYLSTVQKLKRFSDTNYSNLLAGQIVFSSIVNGGLLSRQWMKQIGKGIKHGVIADCGQIWVELKITEYYENEEQTIHRRWFPDPITSLLILRWKKTFGDYWPKMVNNNITTRNDHELLLEQFIISIGFPNKPKLHELIRAAKTYLGLRVPQSLVTYACQHDIGLSLPKNTWARLYSSYVLKKKEPPNLPVPVGDTDNAKTYAFTKLEKNVSNKFGDQLALLKTFRAVFDTEKVLNASDVSKKVSLFIETQKDLSPILFALVQWGKEMISSERLSGKKVAPSTMKRYLSAIAKPLLTNAYLLNLVDLEVTEIDWVDLYDAVLEERISLKDNRYKIGRINDFHFFLAQRYHCSSISIKYDGKIFSNVNVNIVTPKEYQATQNWLLNDNTQDSRITKIQSIILSLGYRCGLRANEALNIKISELHDGQTINFNNSFNVDKPEILIKFNSHGRLKNRTSIRRIPLVLLLNDELDDLLSWKKQRIKELRIASKKSIKDEPLFNFRGEDLNTPKYHDIFPPILLVLKEITRDNDVNFHHLRHSFTNFLLLRLMSDDIDGLLPKEWYFDQTTKTSLLWNKKNEQRGVSLRSQLLVSKQSYPTRKLLYLVSLLSGHIDPNVTMNSYLHLLDWTLGRSLRLIEQPLSLDSQANLLALTPKKLKAYRNRNRLKGNTTALEILDIEYKKNIKRLPNKQLKKMIPLQTVQFKQPSIQEEKPPSPFYLHNIFALIFAGKERGLVAEDYEVSKEALYKWVHCADKLASVKTNRNTLRFFKKRKVSQKQDNLSLTRIIPGYSPACPIKKSERILANSIYNKIHTLYKQDEQLAKQGFNLFLMHASFDKMFVTTRKEKDKKLFVEFMKQLVSKNQIRIDLEPSPLKVRSGKTKEQTPQEQKRYWSRSLSIPQLNITIVNETRKSPTLHPYGKIIIWIASDGKNKNKKPINSILRFALFMAMVSLHYCGPRK
ncbi:hypothetical protein LR004_00070 [Candidatus Gracilibacteria bacterium]|nr:hypothetical protein [Candidatus Gracilibacteria bacterium]